MTFIKTCVVIQPFSNVRTIWCCLLDKLLHFRWGYHWIRSVFPLHIVYHRRIIQQRKLRDNIGPSVRVLSLCSSVRIFSHCILRYPTNEWTSHLSHIARYGLFDNKLFSMCYLMCCVSLGFFVVYVVVFAVKTYSGSFISAQVVCCLFPPLALQIACGAFQRSYDGISTGAIGGIMVRYPLLE